MICVRAPRCILSLSDDYDANQLSINNRPAAFWAIYSQSLKWLLFSLHNPPNIPSKNTPGRDIPNNKSEDFDTD